MTPFSKISAILLGTAILMGAATLAPPVQAASQDRIEAFIGAAEPTLYDTPEAAVAAFKDALAASDMEGLARILGMDSVKLRAVEGIAERIAELRAAAAKAVRVKAEGDIRLIALGPQVWPFPFPVTKGEDGKWAFDTYAGIQEIINRRVGENELQAIDSMRGYVEAQQAYAAADHDDDGVLEYAQKLISTAGQTDGLYWPIEQGDGESPIGPNIDMAALDKAKAGDGYYGYKFRILRGQGNQVAGGRYLYVINGNMIAGYGLIAWPARYADTGVKTFVVNQAGIVYERDFGPDTANLVEQIRRFNPNEHWNVVKD